MSRQSKVSGHDMLRVWGASAVMAGVLFLSACASSEPKPTKANPLWGCHITCPYGTTIYTRQHICWGGKRWFEDIHITGQTGTLWLSIQGDFPKTEVELGTCDSYIRSQIDGRDPKKVGVHPGEDELGHSTERRQ